jgi:hypothetical protein
MGVTAVRTVIPPPQQWKAVQAQINQRRYAATPDGRVLDDNGSPSTKSGSGAAL